MLTKTAILVLLLLVLRALYYANYLIKSKNNLKVLEKYLNDQTSESRDKLVKVKYEIKHIIEIAGLSSHTIPYTEAVGYGHVATGHAKPSENLLSLREDIAKANFELLEESVSIFRSKLINTFNPMFWVESLVYLPTKVLSFLGVANNKTLVKIFQLLWWLLAFVSALVSIFFNEQFKEWISALF